MPRPVRRFTDSTESAGPGTETLGKSQYLRENQLILNMGSNAEWSMWGTSRRDMRGVTLLELMIAIAVLGIIISISAPSYSGFRDTQRLVAAGEQLYGHLQQARSQAISGNTPVFVNFSTDGSAEWTYGISSVNSLCDLTASGPTDANACVVIVDDGDGIINNSDFVLMRFDAGPFPGVEMTHSNFSSSNTQIEFDAIRGMASTGQIDLAGVGGEQLRVRINRLGRITLCSPDGSVANYSASGC